MCGIFGALRAKTPVDSQAALRVMRHRGPDQNAVFRHEGVELAFVRLAILDLTENGAQPMQKGDLTIVFNGEIYDHAELRKTLEQRGVTFRSRSDTEVLLEGYRAFGDRVVERISGMFAFAVWDAREKRLFCARDRAGKKPFFYTFDRENGFRFASEIKAIRASGVRTTVDEAELPVLLVCGHAHADRTLHAEVRELPPGHTLVLEHDSNEPRVARYYHAPFTAPRLTLDYEEATREVRRLVEAAVVRRLEADVPLGAFLSGGIDSTIVVGLMAKHTRGRVKTFSIGFRGDAAYDETRFARMAAEQFGTEHTEFVVEPSSADLVDKLVFAHDGPFGDSSALPTSIVSRLTREHVTVALSGDGGDEIFCGYTRFLAAEASERIPERVRKLAGRLARRVDQGPSERSLRAKARRFFLTAERPFEERLLAYSPYFGDSLDQVLLPDVAKDTRDAPWAFSRSVLSHSRGAPALERILDFNYATYLPYDLLVKTDRSSMLHSLEVRAPFLDRDLTDFAARLPASFVRRGKTTKRILKHAFPEFLPDALVNRPKMGFGVPLGAWFRGSLRTLLHDQLGSGARLYRYVSRPHVEKLLAEQDAKVADHSHRLWLLLTLEVWLSSMEKAS